MGKLCLPSLALLALAAAAGVCSAFEWPLYAVQPDGTLAHSSGASALAAFSPTYSAACASLPAAVPCVTDLHALACGDPHTAYLDLLTATTLSHVAVPAALAHLAPAVCLAPDTDLSSLTALGFWGGWEMRDSALAGRGSHALSALPTGACLGRAVRVYSPRYFNDWPTVAGVNHCSQPSVSFAAMPDAEQGVVHLFLRASRDVAAGEELCADYTAADSPRPNFMAQGPYEAFPF